MAKIKINNTKYGQIYAAPVAFIHCLWKDKMVQPLWNNLSVSNKGDHIPSFIHC